MSHDLECISQRRLGNLIERHPKLMSAMSAMKTSSSCQLWTGLKKVNCFVAKDVKCQILPLQEALQWDGPETFSRCKPCCSGGKGLKKQTDKDIAYCFYLTRYNIAVMQILQVYRYWTCQDSKCCRHINIGGMQIFQAGCQRELQRLGELVSRHRQISQGDPR